MAENHSTVEYRDLPGFPGLRVGDDGSVWSCRQTPYGSPPQWRRLKTLISRGYYIVRLDSLNSRPVHRLVLQAFVGPCPPGMEACHYDGDAFNNRLSNLRWDTRAANYADKIRCGKVLNYSGELHWKARLTEHAVRAMRAEHAAGVSMRKLAQRFGIDYSTAKAAIKGRNAKYGTWKHVV